MAYVYIYTLVCPTTNLVRYVGKSINPIKRFSAHINQLDKKTKKNSWVKSLLSKGLKPNLDIIDTVDQNEWEFWEKHYIKLFKSFGANLTNGTDGGDGASLSTVLKGVKRTDEVKNKISISKLGTKVLEETRRKISDKLRNYKHTEEAAGNMGIAQKKIWGRYSKEQRAERQLKTANKIKKPILMIKDDVITEFISARDAAKEMGLCYKKISAVCNGIRKTHGGYIWKFK